MTNQYLDKSRPNAMSMLNKYTLEELPKVDVIMLSVRPSLMDRIAYNINGQTVNIGKIVIVLQGYSLKRGNELRSKITNCEELILIYNDDTSYKLGKRNNIAFSRTTADYVAIMDDDDIYYPNYLHSQLAYLTDCNRPAIISKINPIGRDEGTGDIGFILTKYREGNNLIGAGGSFVLHRKVVETVGGFADVQVGYDSILMRKAFNHRFRLLSGDPFNFIVTRGRPEGNTWTMQFESGIKFNDISEDEISL